MYDFIMSVICVVAGVVYFVYEIKNKQEFWVMLSAILFILFGSYNSILNSQIFDEVSNNDYDYMSRHKTICFKYQDCKIFYSQIWEDGKTTNYELGKLVKILDGKPELIEEIKHMKEELSKN